MFKLLVMSLRDTESTSAKQNQKNEIIRSGMDMSDGPSSSQQPSSIPPHQLSSRFKQRSVIEKQVILEYFHNNFKCFHMNRNLV